MEGAPVLRQDTPTVQPEPLICFLFEPGPVSVLELLRPADRERLLSTRASAQASQHAPRQVPPPAGGGAVSSGLQQEALAAWKGLQASAQTFRPFQKTPSKQARYELYLSHLRQGHAGETGASWGEAPPP